VIIDVPSGLAHLKMSSMWLSDTQKIGAVFCIAGSSPRLVISKVPTTNSHPGCVFLMLGVCLFFDRALLAMGNILFLLGLLIIIGPYKTVIFFARPQKLKGTAAFVIGIVLILAKWAFIGFAIEVYGIVVLFGDFFGTIAGFAGSVPVVGPYIAAALRKISPGGKRNKELPV